MNSRTPPILVALAVVFLVFPAAGGVLYAMFAVIHYLDLPLMLSLAVMIVLASLLGGVLLDEITKK